MCLFISKSVFYFFHTHSSVLIIAGFEGNIESFHEKNIGINYVIVQIFKVSHTAFIKIHVHYKK